MDRRSFIGSTAVASLASLPLAAAAAEHNHGAHAHGKHGCCAFRSQPVRRCAGCCR